MTTPRFHNSKVGDRVIHPEYGAGTIVGIDSSLYPLCVNFSMYHKNFTLEGSEHTWQKPTLQYLAKQPQINPKGSTMKFNITVQQIVTTTANIGVEADSLEEAIMYVKNNPEDVGHDSVFDDGDMTKKYKSIMAVPIDCPSEVPGYDKDSGLHKA